MPSRAERTLVAFLDGEDSPDISNPIHSTAVAAEYGFRGALVGGVTVYGWTVPPIVAVLGERWLADGWVDVSFRRPVYPGDEVRATVAEDGEGGHDLVLARADGDRCLVGKVGLGPAPFLADLHVPHRRRAEPPPADLPYLTLANAPTGRDLRPMFVPFTRADAIDYALTKQVDSDDRWIGDRALLHPGWLAARMTPMLHHSYDYKPAIHTRSQIQHLAPARVGRGVTVAGHFVEAFERKGHHYAVVDGVILDDAGMEVARLRHTTIFRVAPRGA